MQGSQHIIRAKLQRSCLLGLLLVASGLAQAQSGSDLLMRMNAAFAEANYDGVFTYLSGDEMASLRVVHKIVEGVHKERLVHLNGAPREIIRHGEEVVCIVMPGDDIAVLEDSIPDGPFARAFVRDFNRLSGSYDVQTMGEGRVASRPAVRLAIMPRDEHRYGFKLWLDQQTDLLLRSEMIDSSGQKLEVFQFSSIVFDDAVQDEALEAEEHQGSMISHLTLKKSDSSVGETDESSQQWQVGWLPRGFQMAMADIRQQESDKSMNSMMYSDGIASFSIFLEPMPPHGAASAVSRNGATVVMTRGIGMAGSNQAQQSHGFATKTDYYLATLVGEIPPETAKRILESVATE